MASGRNNTNLMILPTANTVGLSARASAMVFADSKSRTVRNLIDVFGPSEATALVIGETGTGKEIVARAIHERSRRAAGCPRRRRCRATDRPRRLRRPRRR